MTLTGSALRLYPSAPINMRTASVDVVLPTGGGDQGSDPVFIAKGTGVGWSTYHMHRSEILYGPDAAEFRPERWLDGTLMTAVGWGYLPFGGGPRACLGREYSILFIHIGHEERSVLISSRGHVIATGFSCHSSSSTGFSDSDNPRRRAEYQERR